jgi:hypothetical protein
VRLVVYAQAYGGRASERDRVTLRPIELDGRTPRGDFRVGANRAFDDSSAQY